VDAELAGLAAADPLRPDVAAQAVGEQPEVVRLRDGHGHPAALRAEAGALQRHGVVAGRQLGVHGAGRAGPRLPRPAAGVDELQRDVVQRDVLT
jgi:hypothetical protein